jgi:hypothetical protein
MRTIAILLIVLLAAVIGHADDQPLRVFAYGAAGAAVYIAPAAAAASDAPTDSEIGPRAFAKKYLRGTVPVEVRLKPGPYLVSVVLAREQNMRDASLQANEFVWDGYDHHALVPQKSGGWRYAQSYRVQKTEGFPAEVLAVFADQMPLDEALSFDCGQKTTPYTGSDEDAATALTGAGVTMAFHDDVIRGVKAGMKVLLRAGDRRFAIQTDGTVALRIIAAYGQGAWAGHRLGIVSYE